MKPDERIKDIFGHAVERKSPAEREQYLAEACQGDPELRREIESLLHAGEEAGDFLGKTMQLPTTELTAECAGATIGRYKLLEKIGEGGFGVVYMAEQEEPVRRRVALKIIKLGMDTREVVARFEAERQALAMMDHPNIASVFDGGATDTGRPYFVMELVKGVPITEYCDANKLSTRERLQLFRQVCHAVQHAHQKGIIHRDLKPNNILVTAKDDRPVPKVIDFGVAKATHARLTEKTMFTHFRQWIGTPAYMSPEQAGLGNLDVDTRSDVYSLGVLLYELLTSRTPFDKQQLREIGYEAVMRTIREEEPLKPSTRLSTLSKEELGTVAAERGAEPAKLNRLVLGELDWIVMKALEKDRTRRYDTANAMALDLEHHLNNEPVSAVAPTLGYRLKKLLRRNKVAFAAGAIVAAALIYGLAFSLWSLAKERVARQEAMFAERRSQAEAGKSQQVAQFLKDMLQGVGPSVALGRDTTMLREILDKTAARLSQDLRDQPEVEGELRNTLGWVYFDLGDDFTAETFHRGALAIRRKLHGNASPDVAASLHGLGHALWRQGKLAEAETAQREALAIRSTIFGDNHLDTARSRNDLALILYSQGNLSEAEGMIRPALATRRKLLREPHADVADSQTSLAAMLADQGKLNEAESLHREALAMRRKLYGDRQPYVAFSLGALGSVLAREGKQQEAESLLYEAVAMQKELLRSNHPDSLLALYTLAKLLASEGKLAQAAELCHKDPGSEPAAILNSIAWPLATCIHAPVRDGPTAVRFAEHAVTATHRKDAGCLDTLAAAYAEVGQFAKAVSAINEAIVLLPAGKVKDECELRLKLYESNRPFRERGYENTLR